MFPRFWGCSSSIEFDRVRSSSIEFDAVRSSSNPIIPPRRTERFQPADSSLFPFTIYYSTLNSLGASPPFGFLSNFPPATLHPAAKQRTPTDRHTCQPQGEPHKIHSELSKINCRRQALISNKSRTGSEFRGASPAFVPP